MKSVFAIWFLAVVAGCQTWRAESAMPLEVIASCSLEPNQNEYRLHFVPESHGTFELSLVPQNAMAFGLNNNGVYKNQSRLKTVTTVSSRGKVLARYLAGDVSSCTFTRYGERFLWAGMATFRNEWAESERGWEYFVRPTDGLLKKGERYNIKVIFEGDIQRFLNIFGPTKLAVVRRQHR